MLSCLISLPFNLQCLCISSITNFYLQSLILFFNPVRNVHSYNTRLSSRMTYAISKARTNYGIFNIRFQGAKVWNDISDDIKLLSLKRFKERLSRFSLLNTNCRFTNIIFFLAFCCLTLAYLAFSSCLSFSTSFFSSFFLFSLVFILCFVQSVCGTWPLA